MSKESKNDLNEMMAGDGSGLALPPAFVFVNTKKKSVIKRKEEKIDGRKKGAKKLIQRVMSRRKTKMSEEIKEVISEAMSDTEKAQKQIKASKEMRARKELQKKRTEAKQKMSDKSDEMNTLLKARMSDFRKKAAEKQQKATKQVSIKKESVEISETAVSPSVQGNDVFSQAYKIAQEGSSYGREPETSFAMVQFSDGTSAKMGYFDAQKIVAAYEGLTPENREKFISLLNMNATTYTNALNFAVRNV